MPEQADLKDFTPQETSKAESGYGRPQPFHFHRFTGVLNAVGTIWIFALMVLINSDIVGREFFRAPVRGVTELVSLSIVGIVFLQLANTLWVGRFTRAEVLIGRLLRRRPKLGHALQAVFHLTGAALLAIIFYSSLPLFRHAVEIGEYVGAFGDFTAPTWPVRFVLLLGSASTSVTFLFLAWTDACQALRRRP
ncbi:MAG: TRAP transporter small permease [Deltaproteobacteria bacterium]|nr:TRAP transporter small permease [Deltaproteobacteria bacterium]